MLVHGVDDVFLGVIRALHNGVVQDTAELLWEQRGGLEMEASFQSLDQGVLVVKSLKFYISFLLVLRQH